MQITATGKTYDCNGNEVEIPTYKEAEDGEFHRVDNAKDFETLVKSMGYNSVQQFEEETHVKASRLIGKFWSLCRESVAFVGDDVSVQ